MAVIQQTTPAILNRIAQAGGVPSGAADELLVSLATDAGQIYDGLVTQGGMVAALQNRCQRIEAAAVPSATVEELRGLCDKNDQDLKAHITQFAAATAAAQQEVKRARH